MSGRTQVDEAAIRNVLSSYEGALNASDTIAVMPLYAEDGFSCLRTAVRRPARQGPQSL